MFARIDSNQVTYYPESATVIGSDPLRMNPGTDPVFTINPGESKTLRHESPLQLTRT